MKRYFLFGEVGLYLYDNYGGTDLEIKLKEAVKDGNSLILEWEEGVTKIEEFLRMTQGYDGFVEVPKQLGSCIWEYYWNP